MRCWSDERERIPLGECIVRNFTWRRIARDGIETRGGGLARVEFQLS